MNFYREAELARKAMADCPARLCSVLAAILRNGCDRQASIDELADEWKCSFHAAELRYYRDRKRLLEFFGA